MRCPDCNALLVGNGTALVCAVCGAAAPCPAPAPDREGVLAIGDFTLSCPRPGKVWIARRGGEGMQTDEAKLAAVLRQFYEAEF